MILVTGAAGYIGSQIVHALYRLYDQPRVIGVDNLSTGHACPLPHGFECFHGEIGAGQFMTNLMDRYKVTQIIHCAAKVVVPESVEQPLVYYRNNTADSFRLIEVAVKARVQGFVFASTAAVYGTPDLVQRPLREDDPCRPCSPYGQSKLMVEQYLRDVHTAEGLSVVILRYFNVAGADPLMRTGPRTEAASHLIPRVVRAGLGLIPKLFLYSQSDTRDYVHVADIADVNIRALEWANREGGCLTLNVGTGVKTTGIDVLTCTAGILAHYIPFELAQRREGDPPSVVADIRQIGAKLNWAPQYSLHQIIEDAIRWERSKSTTSNLMTPCHTPTILTGSPAPLPRR